ncbi:type II toxin-antitoxin system Phd/YefM family antitoxin [Nocardia sp. CS682]|uniref:type II toxin-antitoxin system Phd/YefM family antitoxin n=1 Tax=Nocardia sp. CS682 TaxID=1047172 RepID=UPI0010754B90|nr:type II toxin-antitoxin system prevent-host-death family antitoxin [Nocardia sp. CS682]QBS44113.1 antitoxin [Nocardia sp. CS682]
MRHRYGRRERYSRSVTALSAQDLRDHTAEVLRRVEAGEEFEIWRDHRPVAKIIPLPRRRQWIPASEIVQELVRLGPDPTGLGGSHKKRWATDDLT